MPDRKEKVNQPKPAELDFPPDQDVEALAEKIAGWTPEEILTALLESLFARDRTPDCRSVARLILSARYLTDTLTEVRPRQTKGAPPVELPFSVAAEVLLMAREEDRLAQWLLAQFGDRGLVQRWVPPRYLSVGSVALTSPSVRQTIVRLQVAASGESSPRPGGDNRASQREAKSILEVFAQSLVNPKPRVRDDAGLLLIVQNVFLPAARRILRATAKVRVRREASGARRHETAIASARRRATEALVADPDILRHFPVASVAKLISTYRFERRRSGRVSENEFALDLYFLARRKVKPRGLSYRALREAVREQARPPRKRIHS